LFKAILPVEFGDGKEMYTAVLSIIQKISPVLSKMIHDNWEYKPFSIVLPNEIHVLCPMLEEMLYGAKGIKVLEQVSHRELMKIDPDHSSLQFRFEKTFFRKWGNINFPLPDPHSIIFSWKQRWNSLFPEKIDVELPGYEEKKRFPVRIGYANIVTHSFTVSGYPAFTAFTGTVRLVSDQSFAKEFHMLARFAEYAGTGAKTTMGAGITKILSGEENADDGK